MPLPGVPHTATEGRDPDRRVESQAVVRFTRGVSMGRAGGESRCVQRVVCKQDKGLQRYVCLCACVALWQPFVNLVSVEQSKRRKCLRALCCDKTMAEDTVRGAEAYSFQVVSTSHRGR
jgi:hypothetical protein